MDLRRAAHAGSRFLHASLPAASRQDSREVHQGERRRGRGLEHGQAQRAASDHRTIDAAYARAMPPGRDSTRLRALDAVYLLLRSAPYAKTERHVFEDCLLRIERVVLKDHRNIAIFRRKRRDVFSADQILPDVTSSSPASIRNVVDLPHPEGPTKTTSSPSAMSNEKS